jgi:hypothetical protein
MVPKYLRKKVMMSKTLVSITTAIATAALCVGCYFLLYHPKILIGPAAAVSKEASCELDGHKYLILKYNRPNQVTPSVQLMHDPDCKCLKKSQDVGNVGSAVGSVK